jgi:hypothetical protein
VTNRNNYKKTNNVKSLERECYEINTLQVDSDTGETVRKVKEKFKKKQQQNVKSLPDAHGIRAGQRPNWMQVEKRREKRKTARVGEVGVGGW